LRSEEDEARWEKEKREEIEYLRYYSGKRYRDAFQLLDNTESRNIVQRTDDEPKSLQDSASGARATNGEKKDARRWVMTAYPTNTVKENIALASIMELYRCNLEKHGRWGALGARRGADDNDSSNNPKRGGGGGDGDNDAGGEGQQQEKRTKATKKEKKEAKESNSGKKTKKHGGGGKKKNEEAETADGVVVESDRARRRREREEAEKALLMAEMKKAKDVARNKNKIQRPDDEDDENDTGDARKLRIVVDEDVLKDESPATTSSPSDKKSRDDCGKKSSKSESGGNKKAKAKGEGGSHGNTKLLSSSSADGKDKDKDKDKDRQWRARPLPKKAPSISSQLRTQKLKTFDDDWLPAECLSDDVFLSVVKNCPVQEIILGADSARRVRKDATGSSTNLTSSRETNLNAAKKRRGGSPSSENLYLERTRDRRSVQMGVDDIDVGRNSSASSSSTSTTRRVLGSPFASSSSATLPPPGSFTTRSFSSSISTPRGSGIAAATIPPAISIDALQKAAASGGLNELTHLSLKRYEARLRVWMRACVRAMADVLCDAMQDLTDSQLESILRIQHTNLTSLRLEGCPQLSDKTLQHLSSSMFGPNLRHLSFKNCPRITNRGVLDLIKTTTNLVSLCLDGCEKISNKPIIHMAKCTPTPCVISLVQHVRSITYPRTRTHTHAHTHATHAGCPNLRHLSLMGCKKISDKSIMEIANHTTNLASLRVSSDRVTGTRMRHIIIIIVSLSLSL
jgi:hypothetical protein